jgi:hypothetical protein
VGRKQEFAARSKWVGRNHLFSARLFASMLRPRNRCSIRSIPATSTASFFVPGPTAPVGEPEPVSGARWRHERPGRSRRARRTRARAARLAERRRSYSSRRPRPRLTLARWRRRAGDEPNAQSRPGGRGAFARLPCAWWACAAPLVLCAAARARAFERALGTRPASGHAVTAPPASRDRAKWVWAAPLVSQSSKPMATDSTCWAAMTCLRTSDARSQSPRCSSTSRS